MFTSRFFFFLWECSVVDEVVSVKKVIHIWKDGITINLIIDKPTTYRVTKIHYKFIIHKSAKKVRHVYLILQREETDGTIIASNLSHKYITFLFFLYLNCTGKKKKNSFTISLIGKIYCYLWNQGSLNP